MKPTTNSSSPLPPRHHLPGMIRHFTALLPHKVIRVMLAIAVAGLLSVTSAHAQITYSGNLSPADPTTWTSTTDTYVGFTSDGTLTIAGGSTLPSQHATLGFAQGVNGTVTVDGAGSSWAASNLLYAGYNGNGTLNITNGGSVTSVGAYLGYNTGSTGTVTVDGTGSAWTDGGNLTIGNSGTGTLNITNGSSVTATGTTTVGTLGTVNFGTNGGTLTTSAINGASSQFTGTGTIVTHSWLGDYNVVYSGSSNTPLTVATWNNANQNINVELSLAAAGGMAGNIAVGYQNSGSLAVQNGAQVASALTYIGYGAGSTGTATVSGTGSSWALSGDLHIGDSGTGTLAVSNGGTITGVNTYLGYNAGSSGTLTLDGAGTALNDSGSIYVGYGGTGTMALTNGATATATGGLSIGANGSVTISGTGSTLSGNAGVGGSLSIANGGTLNSSGSTIDGGIASVSGAGTTWNGGSNFWVGYNGTGTLNITKGGVVNSGYSYLGFYGGSNGTVTVDGTGSTWNVSGYSFYVGDTGTGTLNITDGGTVNYTTPGGLVAFGFGGGSGIATVDGVGSTWTVSGPLTIGSSGTLNITNGSLVTAPTTTVNSGGTVNFGANGGTLNTGSLNATSSQFMGTGTINLHGWLGDSNLVYNGPTITPQNVATWNGANQNIAVNLDLSGSGGIVGDFAVGYQNSGSLTVENGAQIATNNGYIGYNAGSTGIATVSGTGSKWSNTASLYVGNYGTGTLGVTNGATLTSVGAYIGNNTGSTGTVTVDGAGSSWTNTGNLTIGSAGTGTLNITNGSAVTATGTTTVGTLGTVNFGSNGGTLTTNALSAASSQFTGTGTIVVGSWVGDVNLLFDATHGFTDTTVATWNAPGQDVTVDLNANMTGANLDLGYKSISTLTVGGGVTFNSATGYLGYNAGSTGIATISGTGSEWALTGNLYAGYNGTGILNITGGGTVTDATPYIGYSKGVNGTVNVAGSTWSNTGALYVGYNGNGTLNMTSGGKVTDGYGYIGYNAGSTGTVIVNDSTWSLRHQSLRGRFRYRKSFHH